MMRRIGILILLSEILIWATGAQAADSKTVATQAPVPSRQVLSAFSDQYELVLKSDALRPGMKPPLSNLDLYLSDYQTNAPIGNASIDLSLRSATRELWSGAAEPVDHRPGVYMVALQAPPDTGSFTVLVTVRRLDREDKFALSALRVSTGEPGTTGSRGVLHTGWLVGAALLGLAGLFLLTRFRVRGRGTVMMMGILLATVARAHEGHDAAPPTSGAPVGSGAEVYVAKESQFLLGVLTDPLKEMAVQRRLTVLGRVAPRGGGEVTITAPQSGRIYFAGNQPPNIGRAVRKGQAVGRLLVVDALDLKSPITGVITGVFAANGQLVEAGRQIMTVLDPSVVWVHADVYEQDVPEVQQATQATISSQFLPDLLLRARKVAVGVTQGEVPGTVEAWFEAPNPGGHLKVGALVDVGIEQGGLDSSLVVSRGAIFEKDGRKLVFVHTAPERFTAKEVRLGISLGPTVVVEGDLHPGDRIVSAGGYQLLSAPVVSLGH
jgi:hypothetical protein